MEMSALDFKTPPWINEVMKNSIKKKDLTVLYAISQT